MPGVPHELCLYLQPEVQKLYNIPIGEVSYYIVHGTKTLYLEYVLKQCFMVIRTQRNVFKIRYNVLIITMKWDMVKKGVIL